MKGPSSYRPDIDGLRAVAVISVIGFHAFPSVLPGGFIGVDVFFVISGFLISGIIFRDLEAGSFSFMDFYARRVRRIFPALMVVLAATLAFGWYVMLADEFNRLGKHVVAGAGFVSNLLLWDEGNYFNGNVLKKPLVHLWSLGVEEQFYLLWPPILVLAWRRSRALVRWVVVLVTIASFATNLATVRSLPAAAFYSPLSRLWELTAGAVLAHVELGRRQGDHSHVADAKSLLGVALIAVGLLLISESSTFPGAWAAIPTLGTCLVISAGPNALMNRYLLAKRPVVAIGLVSYSLYLWHWPLLSFAHIVDGRVPGAGVRLALIGATSLLAVATYALVERRWRRARGRRPVLVLLGVATANLLVGLAVMRATPRNDGHGVQRVVDAYRDFRHPPNGFEPFVLNGRRYYRHPGGNGHVLFYGDSHLEQYGDRIHRVLAEHPADGASVYLLTTGGCPPIPDVNEDQNPECKAWRADAFDLARRPEIDTIVVGACWNCYFIEQAAPADPAARRGTHASFEYYFEQRDGARTIRKYFRTGEGTEPALAALENHVKTLVLGGKRVFLLLDNPLGSDLDPKTYLRGSRLTTLRCDETMASHRLTVAEQELRRRLTQLAVRVGAISIDPLTFLCVDDACPIRDGAGSFIYRDGNHLRASFAERQISFMDATVQPRRAD